MIPFFCVTSVSRRLSAIPHYPRGKLSPAGECSEGEKNEEMEKDKKDKEEVVEGGMGRMEKRVWKEE